MSVSIKQLKAYVAVVEENSFSLAAERLNATQSGMSMLVQNLELSIGNVIEQIQYAITTASLKRRNKGYVHFKYTTCLCENTLILYKDTDYFI